MMSCPVSDPEETIFHKIVKREVPAEVVYEDETVLAFRDINPASPTHILIVPKRRNLPSMQDVTVDDEPLLGHMLSISTIIAKEQGLSEAGYRLVINTGEHGGQEVRQLHIHLLGGRKLNWPPG